MPLGFSTSTVAAFQYSIYATYTPGRREILEDIQWISSANLGVGYDRAFQGGTVFITPMQSQDYKPAFSPDFRRIAIFRVSTYGLSASRSSRVA